MPPLYAQDPTDALHLAARHGWLDVLAVTIAVACEPWALALLALALFSWLERDVPAVLKAVLPLAAALVAAAALSWAARAGLGGARALGPGEGGAWASLRHLVPGGRAVALAAFAAYSLLAYRRRAAPVLLLLVAGAGARMAAGPHWAVDLAAGGILGAALGAAAWAAALRLFPAGSLARARAARVARRRSAEAPAGPSSP